MRCDINFGLTLHTEIAISISECNVFCVHELMFFAVSCFLLFFFCCRGLFVLQGYCSKRSLLHYLQRARALWWNTSAQLAKLFTPHCTWPLKRLAFTEIGKLTFSWHQNTNCCRANKIVCLDAKGLWKPGRSCILAGSILSLPCAALYGTGQITIVTSCHPALLRNCVFNSQ